MTQVLQSKPVNSVKRISDHNLGLALVILINNSVQGYKNVGYSKLGQENPGLVQNFGIQILMFTKQIPVNVLAYNFYVLMLLNNLIQN